MRLDDHSRAVIRDAGERFFGAAVYLFGSRLDDSRRGGDIDLFLEAGLPAEELVRRETAMIAWIWRRIGEREIDLVIDSGRQSLQIYEAGRRGVRL